MPDSSDAVADLKFGFALKAGWGCGKLLAGAVSGRAVQKGRAHEILNASPKVRIAHSSAGRAMVAGPVTPQSQQTRMITAQTGAKTIKVAALLAAFILVFGATAQANCFKSVSLGEYPLGEWSDAGRTWVVSDTVGSFSDAITTQSALETQKDTLIAQCSTKGKAVIAAVEQRLNRQKANIGPEFDATCTVSPICLMIRDITIGSREYEIDQEIGRMQAWYQGSIGRCQSHFNYTFNTLSPRLCPQ